MNYPILVILNSIVYIIVIITCLITLYMLFYKSNYPKKEEIESDVEDSENVFFRGKSIPEILQQVENLRSFAGSAVTIPVYCWRNGYDGSEHLCILDKKMFYKAIGIAIRDHNLTFEKSGEDIRIIESDKKEYFELRKLRKTK